MAQGNLPLSHLGMPSRYCWWTFALLKYQNREVEYPRYSGFILKIIPKSPSLYRKLEILIE